MPDAPKAPTGAKKPMGFLSRKIGPVPIWLIGVGIVGAYYWYTHFGPGASKAAPAPAKPGGIEVIEVKGQRGPRGPRGRKGPAGQEKKVKVPNVVGKSYTQGGAEIKRAGLIAQRSAPYVGKVRSESPHAGTAVEPGSVVTLRGRPWPPPSRGAQPQASQPVQAVAPMTAGDVYSTAPTANPSGQTYDSGDVAAAMGAVSAVAG